MVPLAELVAQSNRGAPRPEFTAIGSMEWRHWLSALTPSVAQGYTVDWELLVYPGVAVTLLGLAGLTRLHERTVRALWIVVLPLGLIAVGEHTSFFPALFKWLPGYASFRVHGRSGAVLVLMLIVAATLLLSTREHVRRHLVRIGVIALALGVVLGAMSIRAHAEIARPLLYLALATATAALGLGGRSVRLRVIGGLALAGCLFADLVFTDLDLKRIFVTSQDYAFEAPLVAALRESGQLTPGVPPRASSRRRLRCAPMPG